MERLKKLLNRETVLYLFFGVMTTVVNYLVFALFYYIVFGYTQSLLANFFAFAAAVIFAFVVNKMFVFESKSWNAVSLRKEIPAFLAARVGSFALEEAGLFVCEHLLGWNQVTILTILDRPLDGVTAAKLLLSVVVVVANYILCKWVVFKR